VLRLEAGVDATDGDRTVNWTSYVIAIPAYVNIGVPPARFLSTACLNIGPIA